MKAVLDAVGNITDATIGTQARKGGVSLTVALSIAGAGWWAHDVYADLEDRIHVAEHRAEMAEKEAREAKQTAQMMASFWGLKTFGPQFPQPDSMGVIR